MAAPCIDRCGYGQSEPANEPEPEGERHSEANDEADSESSDDEIRDLPLKSALGEARKNGSSSGSDGAGESLSDCPSEAEGNLEDKAGDEAVAEETQHQSLQPTLGSQIVEDKVNEENRENHEPEKDQENEGHISQIAASGDWGPRSLRWRWWRRRHTGDKQEASDDDAVAKTREGAEASGGDDLAVEAMNSQRWAVMDKDGVVVAEDDGLPLTTGSVEAKIEQLLTWMLAPAVHGIPKLGVPAAVDRANELLGSVPGGEVEAAVREVVAGSERTVSLLVANFCLERIPFLGCPSVLLKNTWGNLRSILIIAALYGHDLEKPRTHHEALLCLVPPGEDPGAKRRQSPTAFVTGLGDAVNSMPSPLVSETAQKVARMMIRGALKRATGLQAAVDCFELASLLYSNCIHESVDEDGYVCVVATPASAARDFFKRKSLASSALLWCSLPVLLLGMAAPNFFTLAKLAPKAGTALRELSRMPRWIPAVLLAMPGLLLALHTLSSAGGPRFRKWSPQRLWRRLLWGKEAQKLRDIWPQIVTMSVFTLHAVLPALSAYSAVSMVWESVSMAWGRPMPGWDRLHGLACMMLGLYSFCTCMTQHLKNEKPDAISGETATRPFRVLFRFFNAAWAVTRACCIIAAWTYALLAIDLVATHIERRVQGVSSSEGQQTSALGIIGPVAWLLHAPRDVNPLWSERAIHFVFRIVSVGCQQRLVDLLSRREVLLRLIGAERITAQTVCLLLKGVAVACSQSTSANPIAEFFESVTPPAMCCVFVVAVRAQAMVLGCSLAIAPQVMSSGSLGSTSSFACGLLGGAYVAHAVLQVWYLNQDDLETPPLRLALLVPGSVSGKAKDLLSGAIAGARKRAVQMMAMGIIQRFIRWCFRPRGALMN